MLALKILIPSPIVWWRISLSVLILVYAPFLWAQSNPSAAGKAPANSPLDFEGMRAEMQRLAAKCDGLKLDIEAGLCRQWVPQQRNDQELLFLPEEMPSEKAGSSAQVAWARHFQTARRRHAEFLFDQCRAAAKEGDETKGYRLLWRTLRENPDHAEARRMLGRLAVSTINPRPIARRSNQKHGRFGWPGNSYSVVETAHFLLTSRASARETTELANKLERFYALWTQFFYPLWSPPGLLQARLKGASSPFEKQRQIQVYLLKDKADYVATLGAQEANIGISVGYYNPNDAASYFYVGDGIDATLYHELTHQLLAEATRLDVHDDMAKGKDFWIVEGIAIYLESLQYHQSYWTLGGWESPRVQVARYRAVRDGDWTPWNTFTAGTMQAWKENPNISKLYTQAAGVTHAILDGFGPIASVEDRRERFLKAIVSVYQGQPNTDDLLRILGGDQAQMQYEQCLIVKEPQVESIATNARYRELVLTASELSTDSWSRILKTEGLEWLDLSFSNAQPADLASIRAHNTLRRLSVEGTAMGDGIMDEVAKLKDLEELDVTGCAITNAGIARLRGHRSLKTLWLAKTQVDDDCLPILDSMPALTYVDVNETEITSSAWRTFQQQHPKVNKE